MHHCLLLLFVAMRVFASKASILPRRRLAVFRLFSAPTSSVSEARLSCKLFYNDVYEVILPPTHRFPMHKYQQVRTSLQREFATATDLSFEVSPLATREELETTHCPRYIDRFLTEGAQTAAEIRAVGFPWSVAGTKRALSSVGGTVAAMRSVLRGEARTAGHIAGGTHHAFFDFGEGFCVFSDIAVAANLALLEFPDTVKKILILDLDVHQGNGNAKLFADRPEVFTFSVHCRQNYFSAKQCSDVDVELEEGTGDDEYNRKLLSWVPFLFDVVKPDLVFFQAGVDVHEGDRLGRLALTREGIQRRNDIVLAAATSRGVPLVLAMGGGYPKGPSAAASAGAAASAAAGAAASAGSSAGAVSSAGASAGAVAGASASDSADANREGTGTLGAILESHSDCYRQLYRYGVRVRGQ